MMNNDFNKAIKEVQELFAYYTLALELFGREGERVLSPQAVPVVKMFPFCRIKRG